MQVYKVFNTAYPRDPAGWANGEGHEAPARTAIIYVMGGALFLDAENHDCVSMRDLSNGAVHYLKKQAACFDTAYWHGTTDSSANVAVIDDIVSSIIVRSGSCVVTSDAAIFFSRNGIDLIECLVP